MENILFSTAQLARKTLTAIKQVDVASCPVLISNSVKILDGTLDQHLTFNDHVQIVCKSAQYHTRALRHIRSSLTADMAKTAASALVNSRFDNSKRRSLWCIWLYSGEITTSSKCSCSLSVLITSNPCCRSYVGYQSNTELTSKCQQQRTRFDKLAALLTWHHSVVEYMPTRQLRSSSSLLLQSLQTRTVIACRAFSQAAPRIWNDLRIDIRNSVTFDRFRSASRTHYYRLAFDNGSCTSWSRDGPLLRFVVHSAT